MNALASALGSGDALKTKINNELIKQGLENSTGVTVPTKALDIVTDMSSAAFMQTPVWMLSLLAAVGSMAF
jgi:hypothetical protein